MSLKYIFIICCPLLLFLSCKDDIDDTSASEKEIYFQDYEAPVYPWGYINTSGEIVIEKKYDDLRPFQDGLAIANYKGQWGFINQEGKTIIPHKYRSAYPFKGDLARIQNFDKKYGFIDKSGSMIIPDTFEMVFDFDSDRARAKKDGNYGYINPDGKWAIEPFFKKCSDFENGFAKVYQFGKAGLINPDGEYKIKFEDEIEKIYDIQKERIRIKKDGKFKFISIPDFKISSKGYKNATDFQNNIAAVEYEGKWHLIDNNFREVLSIEADKIKAAGDNKWIVTKDEKSAIITEDGVNITLYEYDLIFKFTEGFAPFQKGDYWGYLNSEGNEVMEAGLPLAWEFSEGMARIIHKGRIGFIDTTMQLAFPDGFLDAHNFSSGLAHVQ